MTMLKLIVAGVLLLVALAGCDASDSGASGEGVDVLGQISRSDVPKGEWPLTVSRGDVGCDGIRGFGSVIFTAPGGTRYAVNGTAQTKHTELPKIDVIWKKPDSSGRRISLKPIIDKGLETC